MPIADNGTEQTTDLLRQLRDTLKHPIESQDQLVDVLASPLDLLGLLPASSSQAWTGPRGSDSRQILLTRFIGSLQTAVLDYVIDAWWDVLEDDGAGPLLEGWFCPVEPNDGWDVRRKQDAARIALASYQTLASALTPIRPSATTSDPSSSSSASSPALPSPSVLAFVLPLLARLSSTYPLSILYETLFHPDTNANTAKSVVIWDTLARTLVSIPAKVMNATEGGRRASVPRELFQEIWFERLTSQMELVVMQESSRSDPSKLTPPVQATPLAS